MKINVDLISQDDTGGALFAPGLSLQVLFCIKVSVNVLSLLANVHVSPLLRKLKQYTGNNWLSWKPRGTNKLWWKLHCTFDKPRMNSSPQTMACLVPAGVISTTTLPHFPAALGLWRVVLTAALELEERGAVAWQDLAPDVLLCFQRSSRNNP